MKPTLRIHQPRIATRLPTHELAARRHRSAASLPLLRIPAPPRTSQSHGRKSVVYPRLFS